MTSSSALPFSPAAENNKQPILDILQTVLAGASTVLEIGSGTGQHAVYLGEHLPHLHWQASDLPAPLPGIAARIAQADLPNVAVPIALDVADNPWPLGTFDAVYSANVVHIVGWDHVVDLFRGVGQVLNTKGVLCLYGPYKYGGQYTTQSNANFDEWLKDRDPRSGIKDFEAVNDLALAQGLALVQDHPMPANNQLLVWCRA